MCARARREVRRRDRPDVTVRAPSDIAGDDLLLWPGPATALDSPGDGAGDGASGARQPLQPAAVRPAPADGLGAQRRPLEDGQADRAVAEGGPIAEGRYRRRDADALRRHPG